MRSSTRRFALSLVTVVALALAACSPSARVTYIPEGGSYTEDDLVTVLESADPDEAARIAPEDIAAKRQEALADLRRHGDDAAAIADILTAEFPLDVTAVPFLVERGTYENESAWIVLEAWAEDDDSPVYRRVWVFATDDGALLAAKSVR